MNLEEEREKRGRESGESLLVDGGLAGVCTGEAGGLNRRMSREHACHCAGPGSPTMAVLCGWVCREDRLSSAKCCHQFH